MKLMKSLRLRWKMLVVVLPLVLIPLIVVGGIVSYTSVDLARQGINKASMDDLEHMAAFTRHLLESHHQQFQVYQKERKDDFITDLKTLAKIAENMVAAEQRLVENGEITLKVAQQRVRKQLKQVNIGETGYLYALTSDGTLQVHVAREQENILNEQDGDGRFFIRQMVETAKATEPGELNLIRYPWRNEALGDTLFREKLAAYLYFPQWDWVIAAAGYISESYTDMMFEQQALNDLKEKIKQKKVGLTGYIFCMNSKGTFTIHPQDEGQNFIDIRDRSGHEFIREMCEKKQGWIRYPWGDEGAARMKIVRYEYFEPWDWIVAVGCYEDEFYEAANTISWNSAKLTLAVTLLTSLICVLLVSYASKVFTDPIREMIRVIRRVKKGHLDEQMDIDSNDELGELAHTFNRMTEIITQNQEMQASLAQHGKMASLGVLSSGVAHEINNPLGVILGYAGYIENKIGEKDPNYHYIHEIKRESKRCRKIVQDLLSYARTPQSVLEKTDINALLDQIVDFAANHTDMHHVTIVKNLSPGLPELNIDGDQMRQVAINLILNAGGAIKDHGRLEVETRRDNEDILIIFRDSGVGIEQEILERIFEPFFTTKEKGTGLGLAISKQIIEQHHGSIHMTSTPGVGTTVTVRLPQDSEEYLL
ncbi:cache domain-containing protein [Desulfuromonas acetoxidans]|uniref:histidine kinase n=1 Tax=Desulfuromonas acetoxidans (strain DSM 684 / 11070) TaxID=281689 RepID=Q1K2E8_DESA6|nr:cache domain-containing protein [Desulfuromonas acetoxidans]EAT16491.1 periplasmic sensor signal transduction histidine kinase [Desulfuromonas acetoxidans DSM 684]MBF0647074.1 Cache 3/Cache 2 fusion domain-containing protein [Desulfuromonas acetoxidans]NVD26213.1 Cache 3/Cache 2 fusion domain-containing protein [Desulfuromonas acetoxidans]NVE14855.1 Cache 3/Cache 2 fusion domain-containing protein [Desulfuromonas acetoxidans]